MSRDVPTALAVLESACAGGSQGGRWLSRIEGTEAALVDLLTFEAQEAAAGQAAPPSAEVE